MKRPSWRSLLSHIARTMLLFLLGLGLTAGMACAQFSTPQFSTPQSSTPQSSTPQSSTPDPQPWYLNLGYEDAAPTAPVTVDGRQIFQLSESGEFTAQERAEMVSETIEEMIQAGETPKVAIEQRGNLPVITLNGEYLLTVTDLDVEEGRSPSEQAGFWLEEIDRNLQLALEERTDEFRRQTLLHALAVVALTLLASLVLKRGLASLAQRFLQPRQTDATTSAEDSAHTVQQSVLHLILLVIRIVLWIAATVYIANLFPVTRRQLYSVTQAAIAAFQAPLLHLGEASYSLVDLVILAALIVVLFVCSGRLSRLLRDRVLQLTGINRSAQEAVTTIARYAFISIGTVILLQVWGLDLSTLTILASALGVGIGFGMQDIAKNFGSGLVLMFERPIQIGDFVEVGNYMGTVQSIGARSTVIRTLDNISIIVPNCRFLEEEVINWSHDNPVSRIPVPVSVAYGSDVPLVKDTLLEAAKENPQVRSFPKPQVLFKGFGENSLDFDLLVWSAEPASQYVLKSDLYFRIEDLFRDRNIEIPFPQRDLHVRWSDIPNHLPTKSQTSAARLPQDGRARNE